MGFITNYELVVMMFFKQGIHTFIRLIFRIKFLVIIFIVLSDGFRKVVDPQGGSLKHEKDEWEFHHPSFQQGKSELLPEIKRKVGFFNFLSHFSCLIIL